MRERLSETKLSYIGTEALRNSEVLNLLIIGMHGDGWGAAAALEREHRIY